LDKAYKINKNKTRTLTAISKWTYPITLIKGEKEVISVVLIILICLVTTKAKATYRIATIINKNLNRPNKSDPSKADCEKENSIS
jgi:hypothetical protein